MTEAAFHIGIFTDNATTVQRALQLWRVQAPAYLYVSSDGPYPKRPPLERTWPKTWPNCRPNCTDADMVVFWHGQTSFTGHDGLCQETCRDLGHTQMGIATLGNVAETAHHQGWDLWGENMDRIVAAAEFHASLMADAPASVHQPAPGWLTCTGASVARNNSRMQSPRGAYPPGGSIIGANGSTFEIIHHHFHSRLGLPMPNVSALLPKIRPLQCWDHMCWETLTHGGSFNVSRAAPGPGGESCPDEPCMRGDQDGATAAPGSAGTAGTSGTRGTSGTSGTSGASGAPLQTYLALDTRNIQDDGGAKLVLGSVSKTAAPVLTEQVQHRPRYGERPVVSRSNKCVPVSWVGSNRC